MDAWLWIAGALLVGVVLGAASALLLARRKDEDRETVARLRGELEGYQQEVSEHFVKTAELVNSMTRSYKAVYDHLEQGAHRLVGAETLRKELGYVEDEPVKLEYIGRRNRPEVDGADRHDQTGPDDSFAHEPEVDGASRPDQAEAGDPDRSDRPEVDGSREGQEPVR
jgi:uncharacterized membrane-anchored protein YhcB (DUF1043 family)